MTEYQPYVCTNEDGCSLAGVTVQVACERDIATGSTFALNDDLVCTECGKRLERKAGY